jgi:hypothetical protein
MAPKFMPVWGSPKPGRSAGRTGTRPAAAAAPTDDESGSDDAGDLRRSLQALDAMRRRGLIGEAEYAERRRDLLRRSEAG